MVLAGKELTALCDSNVIELTLLSEFEGEWLALEALETATGADPLEPVTVSCLIRPSELSSITCE